MRVKFHIIIISTSKHSFFFGFQLRTMLDQAINKKCKTGFFKDLLELHNDQIKKGHHLRFIQNIMTIPLYAEG